MISYLFNALSAAASTTSGTPDKAEELRRDRDVSPRCVADAPNNTGKNDSAAGCTGGDGPTPSHDGNSLSTSREVKINSKTDKTKEYVEGDGSETKLSLEVMAVTPDGKQQPITDGVASNNDERMGVDKIAADIGDTTSGTMIVHQKQSDRDPLRMVARRRESVEGRDPVSLPPLLLLLL